MAWKNYFFESLSFKYLFIWITFVVVSVAYIILSKISVDFLKFAFVYCRWMWRYCLSVDDGFLDSFLSEFENLKPTPRKVNWYFQPFLYIDKPADIQIILNHTNCLNKADIYKVAGKPVGRALFASEVPIWRPHRRLISVSFHTKMLKGFFPIFDEKNRKAMKKLQKFVDTDVAVNVWDHFADLSLDTICATMFGIEDVNVLLTETEKREFVHNIENYSKQITKRILCGWLHPDVVYTPLSRIRGWNRPGEELIKAAEKVLSYKKELILEEESKSIKKDENAGIFLRDLLDANKAEKANVQGDDVRQELLFMMLAGIETTSLTLCFTLLMFGMNLSIQEEVFKEIVNVTDGGDERSITMEDIEKMELLDRCVKETLRLFPLIPLIARQTTADIKLSDDRIAEKDCSVIIIPYCVHRSQELYENPHIWEPDRFLPQRSEKRHPYSYIPLSSGPRGCIGGRYGILSTKLTLAMMLKKYRITTDTKMSDLKFELDVVLRNINGYKVKIHTRI